MAHYAIGAFRDGTGDPSKVMLYKFAKRAHRDAWTEESVWRMSASRDLARLVFPSLRNHEGTPEWWVPLDLTVPVQHAGAREPLTVKVEAAYFYDYVLGSVAVSDWQIVPSLTESGQRLLNAFRRTLRRSRWKA